MKHFRIVESLDGSCCNGGLLRVGIDGAAFLTEDLDALDVDALDILDALDNLDAVVVFVSFWLDLF